MRSSSTSDIDLNSLGKFGDHVKLRTWSRWSVVVGVALEFLAYLIISVCALSMLIYTVSSLCCDDVAKTSTRGLDFPLGLAGAAFVVIAIGTTIAYPLRRLAAIMLSSYDTSRDLRDPSAPLLLYLRGFEVDADSVSDVLHSVARFFRNGLKSLNPINSKPKTLSMQAVTVAWNVENVLWEAMSSHIVVAIGRPAEIAQKPGAARVYFENDHWQAAVMRMMDNANLIIVLLNGSGSPGLQWELETLKARDFLDKTVFLTVDGAGSPLPPQMVARDLRKAGIEASAAIPMQQFVYRHAGKPSLISIGNFDDPIENLIMAFDELNNRHPALGQIHVRRWGSRRARRIFSASCAALVAMVICGGITMNALDLRRQHDEHPAQFKTIMRAR